MEKHPCPVDFQNPTLENFIRHLDYREQLENATPFALKHEVQAMIMFLRAYGLPKWEIRLPTPPKSHKRILPLPDIVHKFFTYKYCKDPYKTKLFQYMFYHSFLIGWRAPSEILEMKTSDVNINKNGTGYIIITEPKKRKSQRTVVLPRDLISDYRRKSFKNWIDKWRPKVENYKSGDHLYLQPNGKPFTKPYLGKLLRNYGKMVWNQFQPYDMRHWCAIARLISTKVNTGHYDVIPVKNWLGHDQIQTTMSYIKYAEQYHEQAPYDWLKRILKFHTKNAEGENALKSINGKKTSVSNGTPPREKYGLEEI
jgi:integrase